MSQIHSYPTLVIQTEYLEVGLFKTQKEFPAFTGVHLSETR